MSSDEMTYRPLGRCGTRVSSLSLGGWLTFGGSVTEHRTVSTIIRRAYEAGINFFDIADIYARGESEKAMGRALAGFDRHTLVISTKLFWPMSDNTNDRGLSRKHIVESVEKSLTRIGIDYIDIYFCHRPDPDTPIEETLRAMDDLVHQGKILYWGTSEWSGAQLREVCELADRRNLYRPQVEQPQYNLFDRGRFENDLLPAVQEWGLGTVVWSPLASGLLTGKYDEGVPPESRLAGIDWLKKKLMTEENLDAVRRMSPIAERLGCSRAQLALAWARRQPGVSSVITGATSLAQLEENLGSLAVNLDEEGGRALDEIFPPVQGFAQK